MNALTTSLITVLTPLFAELAGKAFKDSAELSEGCETRFTAGSQWVRRGPDEYGNLGPWWCIATTMYFARELTPEGWVRVQEELTAQWLVEEDGPGTYQLVCRIARYGHVGCAEWGIASAEAAMDLFAAELERDGGHSITVEALSQIRDSYI